MRWYVIADLMNVGTTTEGVRCWLESDAGDSVMACWPLSELATVTQQAARRMMATDTTVNDGETLLVETRWTKAALDWLAARRVAELQAEYTARERALGL